MKLELIKYNIIDINDETKRIEYIYKLSDAGLLKTELEVPISYDTLQYFLERVYLLYKDLKHYKIKYKNKIFELRDDKIINQYFIY